MMHELDLPSSASVRLMDARSGQCRAIIGYLGGVCHEAVICGLPVAPATVSESGVPVEYSWCPQHKALYLNVPTAAVRIPNYCLK